MDSWVLGILRRVEPNTQERSRYLPTSTWPSATTLLHVLLSEGTAGTAVV